MRRFMNKIILSSRRSLSQKFIKILRLVLSFIFLLALQEVKSRQACSEPGLGTP